PEQAPSPRLLLDDFFQAVTDALARTWGRTAFSPRAYSGSDALIARWLEALFTAASPQVAGSPAPLNRLAGSFQAWLRRLHVAGDRHFRVAFRLEAPPSPAPKATGWQLQFLLQARDDPSLLLPAQQVWQTDGATLAAGGRVIEQPQEMLLAGLGYAARLFPPLRRSLQDKQPVALSLSNEEVYTFLREAAPLLEESGFAVFVPSWWQQTRSRLGLRLRLKGKTPSSRDAVSGGLLSLERLLHFSWELTLGDTPLTRQEFESLVALKSPLVQVRGQWVRLDPEQVERVLQFWQRHEAAGREVDLLEALQLQLAEEVDGLPVQEVVVEESANDWLEPLNRREKLAPLPPPQTLRATLRPYQERGYAWLDFMRRAGLGACLADDMGLGKTLQTLAALLRVKEKEGRLPAPTLLVAPTSVLINWAKEAERFTPGLSVWIHHGPQRLQGEALINQARQTDILVTSYAILRRDAETLRQIAWFGVVLDEAQNIKNPDTKQARAARRMPAQFRLALTGTPIENRLSELWSIFHFLNPGYLGARQTFRRRFALPIERYNDEAAAARLRRLTAPFILRRLKTDPAVIQDLPDKVETKVYCPLTTEQASLYEAVVQESLTVIEDAAEAMRRRGLVLSMLMKLKQICNHPAQFLHEGNGQPPAGEPERRSGKLRRLLQMLDEILAGGERALIFTQFSEMGHLLRHTIQQRLGVPALFLYGATPSKQRAAMVQRFQEDSDAPPVFILSLKAGGTGLNLTRATHVFHFDRWWNPAVEDQATDRAFRIGQKRNVEVHKFVCVGTLEERIDEMIEAKKSLARRIVGSGEDWLTELSTDDLRDLVALRRELIEE
ncbi:MAG: DEAD/DEAH box helicase, partial [Caldilineae bacterium]